MIKDTYKTVEEIGQGIFTEKKSKFISYIVPIESVDDVKPKLDAYKKEYYDARHICWAYMLGADRLEFRANDDGEPSGTAGKPILGQINSNELTNVLLLVVRYFGGIKLGTSGLITAYKEAATESIRNALVVEKTVDIIVDFKFEYPFMNDVMKIVKDLEPTILTQEYDMDCKMSLKIRKSLHNQLTTRLEKVESLSFNNLSDL